MFQQRIARFQPITWEYGRISVLDQVERFCQGGTEWVQLRVKKASAKSFSDLAKRARDITERHGAKLILDDRVPHVEEVGADGVHLGEKDLPPQKARESLSEGRIIGGTADRYERIEELKKTVDYIGCGPYRDTRTKEAPSPALGIDGYRRIFASMKENGIDIPIVAIGGIEKEDVPLLIREGAFGIALSSAITEAEDPVRETAAFIEQVLKYAP